MAGSEAGRAQPGPAGWGLENSAPPHPTVPVESKSSNFQPCEARSRQPWNVGLIFLTSLLGVLE